MLLKYICNKNSIYTKFLDTFQAFYIWFSLVFFFLFYAFSLQRSVQQLN